MNAAKMLSKIAFVMMLAVLVMLPYPLSPVTPESVEVIVVESGSEPSGTMAVDGGAATVNLAEPERSADGFYHAEIHYWQSYSAAPHGGSHTWFESSEPYQVYEVPTPKTVRTGYLFTTGDQLIMEDLANREYFSITESQPRLQEGRPRPRFAAHSYVFHFGGQQVHACMESAPEICASTSIPESTFPYLWAESKGVTLVITNHGLALQFRDGAWHSMYRHGDIYDLDPRNADVLQDRPTQFYSSIQYRGMTLLGEWPTGRLYEFDGQRIVPSAITPPMFTEISDQRIGYEAQSMAEYCGDLFVGYWPTGEVFRLDGKSLEWSLLKRFFYDPSGNSRYSFVPGISAFGPVSKGLLSVLLSPRLHSFSGLCWKDDDHADQVQRGIQA